MGTGAVVGGGALVGMATAIVRAAGREVAVVIFAGNNGRAVARWFEAAVAEGFDSSRVAELVDRKVDGAGAGVDVAAGRGQGAIIGVGAV